MNRIDSARKVCGVWLLKTYTPDGSALLINHKGTKAAAIEKALYAKPEKN